jgi:hypothetical protein
VSRVTVAKDSRAADRPALADTTVTVTTPAVKIASPIGQRARGEEDRGERQGVGVDRPPEPAPRAEIGGHVRESDVGDRHVKRGEWCVARVDDDQRPCAVADRCHIERWTGRHRRLLRVHRTGK